MSRIGEDAVVATRELTSIYGETVSIPAPDRLVHLQFRRYAGCPFCTLHLRSIAARHDELAAAGVQEVAVFHSAATALLAYEPDLPFAVIADPERQLYAEFGVEPSLRALLDPRGWPAGVRGAFAKLRRRSLTAAVNGGVLGLPADFLIAADGRVLACRYGAHAYDQWEVDDVLELARQADGSGAGE